MNKSNFSICLVCGSGDFTDIYSGQIRDGMFGSTKFGIISRCNGCGIDRLNENACLPTVAYQSQDYRVHLNQDHDLKKHYIMHDHLAYFTLEQLRTHNIRGCTIADVGCAGGALLDHFKGLTDNLLAIEPSTCWSDSLIRRGYKWYPSVRDAGIDYSNAVDVVISTQVIEHVDNPLDFLAAIAEILTKNGIAIISTPNRSDILMDLLPDTFPQFFYRSQHRWAFDAGSLRACAEHAGLSVREVRHVHRYGLANALFWLKDKQPRGNMEMYPIDPLMDKHWSAWLESVGKSDNLYMVASRKG